MYVVENEIFIWLAPSFFSLTWATRGGNNMSQTAKFSCLYNCFFNYVTELTTSARKVAISVRADFSCVKFILINPDNLTVRKMPSRFLRNENLENYNLITKGTKQAE